MTAKLLMLAILCALTAMTIVAAGQTSRDAQTWAVVIGISKYQKLPGGQQLQFADRDAALFAETIRKRGVSAQNIKVLTGAEATAAAIKSAIGTWLARSAAEKDTVLIFYSGHGFFERDFGESYLFGFDSDPKDPYATAVPVGELGLALSSRVRSARVLVIADAVRRDFFDPETDPESARSFAQSFDRLSNIRPGLSALIGSGPGEFSREGQRWGGQGVFTRHLADVLFDGADRSGNVVSVVGELFDLLKGRIAHDTSARQHPWRSGTTLAQTITPLTEPRTTRSDNVDRSSAVATPNPPKVVEQSKPPEITDTREKGAAQRRDPAKEPKQVAEPTTERAGDTVKPTEKAQPGPIQAGPARSDPNPKKQTPAPVAGEKKQPPAKIPAKTKSVTNDKSKEPALIAKRGTQPEPSAPAGTAPGGSTANISSASSGRPESKPPPPAPTRSAPVRAPAPPGTEPVRSTQPSTTLSGELSRTGVAVAEIPLAPKPAVTPPGAIVVGLEGVAGQPSIVTASVPTTRPEAAPTPLILELEAAIASKNLIEPRNANAWDFYQRLAADPVGASDAARLKPALVQALADQGRALVSTDVRGDNISNKVDDFKRAGQMLARARTLSPDNAEVIALEKLSAAQALIALQFYDEAERALGQLQTARLAAVENALGLVFHGKLDTWRAERAFKRAIELDPKWAAPHYNLALLHRSQQNQAALEEFEAAASLDPANVSLLVALGDEHFTRQQWKQAENAFRKAIAAKPSDDALHTKLGHALYSQGLQDEANREYQKARELRAKQP